METSSILLRGQQQLLSETTATTKIVPNAGYCKTRNVLHTCSRLKGQLCFTVSRSWRHSGPIARPVGSRIYPLRQKVKREVACSMDAADEVEKEGISDQTATLTGIRKWEEVFKHANSFLPYAVLTSTILALLYPPSFAWFTTKFYAPALGFLMFAVGVNLSLDDFKHVIQRPGAVALGLAGQYIVKPLLGLTFAAFAVRILGLPEAIGSGLILVSCVSGAQLSNYATFLTVPSLAPLSIVLTALSTALAVVVTPLLTLLLLGRRLPIDLYGMIVNITEIVVAPIAAGLFLNRFMPTVSRMIRPFLPLVSLLTTSCCIGSPLAVNTDALRSPFGLRILFPVIGFHTATFIAGYKVTEAVFPKAADLPGLAKTISFETVWRVQGMQSSLLGLALANKFFADPLVGLPLLYLLLPCH